MQHLYNTHITFVLGYKLSKTLPFISNDPFTIHMYTRREIVVIFDIYKCNQKEDEKHVNSLFVIKEEQIHPKPNKFIYTIQIHFNLLLLKGNPFHEWSHSRPFQIYLYHTNNMNLFFHILSLNTFVYVCIFINSIVITWNKYYIRTMLNIEL